MTLKSSQLLTQPCLPSKEEGELLALAGEEEEAQTCRLRLSLCRAPREQWRAYCRPLQFCLLEIAIIKSCVTKLRSTRDVQITPYPLYLRDFTTSKPLQELRKQFEQQEAAKADRLRKIAALRKYLFDFGSLEYVGRHNIEGHRTAYTPVLASAVWDETRGYGFDKPAFRDEDRLCLKGQKLDRDATRAHDHVMMYLHRSVCSQDSQLHVLSNQVSLLLGPWPPQSHCCVLLPSFDGRLSIRLFVTAV